MKKVFFVALFAVLALASCKNNAESTDVTLVDSTSVAVDSTTIDSTSVDTTLVAPGHVPAE